MSSALERRVVLVYDGTCGFCRRALRLFLRFDLLHRLELFDGSDARLAEARFPELAGADVATAMYTIADGRRYRGFDAFRRAMWESPVLKIVTPLLYVPGVRALGVRLYDLVARNRHALGCSSGSCRR
ncbi:MAG: DUF393 domain-containing protein [bacterium]|nr:DUF393 domain-containing protein [bacterium]